MSGGDGCSGFGRRRARSGARSDELGNAESGARRGAGGPLVHGFVLQGVPGAGATSRNEKRSCTRHRAAFARARDAGHLAGDGRRVRRVAHPATGAGEGLPDRAGFLDTYETAPAERNLGVRRSRSSPADARGAETSGSGADLDVRRDGPECFARAARIHLSMRTSAKGSLGTRSGAGSASSWQRASRSSLTRGGRGTSQCHARAIASAGSRVPRGSAGESRTSSREFPWPFSPGADRTTLA